MIGEAIVLMGSTVAALAAFFVAHDRLKKRPPPDARGCIAGQRGQLHDFRPRYDALLTASGFQGGEWGNWVCDVCVDCGQVVERPRP